jgi:hypothetical protein
LATAFVPGGANFRTYIVWPWLRQISGKEKLVLLLLCAAIFAGSQDCHGWEVIRRQQPLGLNRTRNEMNITAIKCAFVIETCFV